MYILLKNCFWVLKTLFPALTSAMGWTVSPTNSYVKATIPRGMALGWGNLWGVIRSWWGHEGWGLTMVLVPLEETPRERTLVLPTTWGHSEKVPCASQHGSSHQNLTQLALWPYTPASRMVGNKSPVSRTVVKKCVFVKLPSCSCTVIIPKLSKTTRG